MAEPDENTLRELVERLSLDERCDILSGADFWTVAPVPRIGLRRLVLSDGPNGVRGTSWDERDVSLLLPVASAVAATWDRAVARRAGELFGDEARRRGVHVVLAPTVNIQRTPRGGRHFENFSEDPLLVGVVGAEVVAGVQSRGVAATPKHYVANDSETDRMTYDVHVDERTLREVYLFPFEHITRHARPWAMMAAYNAVEGALMTEHRRLNADVLKGEWGFDGVLMSDWIAARDTGRAANGGLDLAMPGPGTVWAEGRLAAAVRGGLVPPETVDDKALRMLRLAARTGALGEPFAAEEPAAPVPPPGREADGDIREMAARGFVLLRNSPVGGGGSPLPLAGVRSVALIGENALFPASQGGGSSQVAPVRVVSPADGLREALGEDVRLTVARGGHHRRLLDELPAGLCLDPVTREPGVRLTYLGADGGVLGEETRGRRRVVWLGRQELPEGTETIRAATVLTGAAARAVEASVQGTGTFTARLNGRRVHVGRTADEVGWDVMANLVGPPERRFALPPTAERADATAYEAVLEVELALDEAAFVITLGLGLAIEPADPERELAEAIRAARDADVAVVVVGTNPEIETEGRDRDTLALPAGQDALVRAVVAANPRTVVVVNAASPVLLPWADEVPAVLWTWFGGQEYGHALADVLLGRREPSGRMPFTLPLEEGSPAPGHVPVDGVLDYAEGTLVGHRAYAAAGAAPRFAFGHGLGYGEWEYEGAAADGLSAVTVTVRNTAAVDAREVVQVYARRAGSAEPARLAGFAVAEVPAGAARDVVVELDARVLGGWDTGAAGWAEPVGAYELLVGRSVADVRLTVRV